MFKRELVVSDGYYAALTPENILWLCSYEGESQNLSQDTLTQTHTAHGFQEVELIFKYKEFTCDLQLFLSLVLSGS